MKELFSLFKKKIVMELLIRCGILNKKRITIKGRPVLFTDISKSKLLKEIVIEGYESYEGELVTLLERYPWRIERFIDAGAYLGFYSVLASVSFAKNTEIIAIEPFPDNIKYIKKVMSENNLDFKLVEKALDSSDRDAVMYYPVSKKRSRLPNSSSLINSFQETGGIFNHIPYKTLTVRTITLPAVIGENASPSLIKLDCEGNELSVLGASSSVLKRENVDFIIEIIISDKNKDKVFNLMKENGYAAYLMTNAGFVKEDRPLTLPKPGIKARTIWKNHFFTKKPPGAVKDASLELYGYYI